MRTLLLGMCFCCTSFLFAQNKIIDSLEQQLLVFPPDTNRLKILNDLAFKYKYSNQARAIVLVEEAEQLAIQFDHQTELAKNFYVHAYIHYANGAHQKAIDYLDQSLKIAKKENLTSRQAYCNGVKAMVYGRMSEYDLALKHNLAARDLFKQIKDTLTLAAIVTNTATIHEERGNFDTALVYYFESLKYKNDSGNRHFATTELANIGACYMMLGEYDLSLQYNSEGLKQAKTTSNLFSHLKANRGNTFLKMGQLDSALTNGLVAYKIDREKNTPYFLLNSTKLLGEVYEKLDRTELAIQFFQEGIEVAKKMENIDFQASIGCRLGDLYLQAGQLDKAKTVLENAYQKAAQIGGIPNLECTAANLSKVFEAMGKYELALFYYKKKEAYQDSIIDLEKNLGLVELEKKYRTEQQSKQIFEKDLTISKQQTHQRNLIIGGLSIFLVLLGIFQFLRYRLRLGRQKAELALEVEKIKAKQLEEMDELKSNFFANISHEFRTPLTLILNPLKKLESLIQAYQNNHPNEERFNATYYLNLIAQNAKRMLQLINQLLDLSKLEKGKMKLEVSQSNLVKFLRTIIFSFESLAIQKQIFFQTEFPADQPKLFFDKDKLEKIVNNLLSNAFKFTPAGGTVSVMVAIKNEQLKVEISDTGKGIPRDELDKIFNRFYQLKTDENSGTGIGLSLVKELVALHKGQITLESEIGKGTIFKLNLPVGKSYFDDSEIQVFESNEIKNDLNLWKTKETSFENHNFEIINFAENSSPTLPIILVVEDHPDLREFMFNILKKNYQVILAKNGQEGFEQATAIIPDLILSDIMMPITDGNEMAKQLKTDERTSHIPIILLTAKAGNENKIEGLEMGVDAYLTKPFDEKELLVRIQNLIEQRKLLRARFTKEIKLQPKDIAITSMDEIFLNKVLDEIENHMSDSTFSVEVLGKLVGMSRSQLHRKLTALCDQSPNFLIRKMRLERGKVLIEKGAGSISEIAYEVGFSSPAYFSKCFQDQYGKAPSELKS